MSFLKFFTSFSWGEAGPLSLASAVTTIPKSHASHGSPRIRRETVFNCRAAAWLRAPDASPANVIFLRDVRGWRVSSKRRVGLFRRHDDNLPDARIVKSRSGSLVSFVLGNGGFHFSKQMCAQRSRCDTVNNFVSRRTVLSETFFLSVSV